MSELSANRFVRVVGRGVAAAPADAAEVTLGVDLVEPTASAARDAAASAMTGVVEALTGLGIERTGIRTTDLSLAPEIEYRPDGSQRRIGFRFVNRVTVRLADPSRVAAVVDAAMRAGATSLDGVAFRTLDDAQPRRAALAAAIEDARQAADTLVEAAGGRLGAVRSIRETDAGPAAPVPRLALMEARAADTPVLAGTGEVRAWVEVTWDLDPEAG